MMHTSISHKWPMQLFQKLTQGLPQKVLLLLLVQDLFNRLQDFSKKLSKMLIQGLFKKLQILFKRLIHNVFRSCSKALQGLLRVIPSTSLDITGLRSLHSSMFWFGAQNTYLHNRIDSSQCSTIHHLFHCTYRQLLRTCINWAWPVFLISRDLSLAYYPLQSTS